MEPARPASDRYSMRLEHAAHWNSSITGPSSRRPSTMRDEALDRWIDPDSAARWVETMIVSPVYGDRRRWGRGDSGTGRTRAPDARANVHVRAESQAEHDPSAVHDSDSYQGGVVERSRSRAPRRGVGALDGYRPEDHRPRAPVAGRGSSRDGPPGRVVPTRTWRTSLTAGREGGRPHRLRSAVGTAGGRTPDLRLREVPGGHHTTGRSWPPPVDHPQYAITPR